MQESEERRDVEKDSNLHLAWRDQHHWSLSKEDFCFVGLEVSSYPVAIPYKWQKQIQQVCDNSGDTANIPWSRRVSVTLPRALNIISFLL